MWARAVSFVVSTAILLWPALVNGYPLVFGDTSVYLTDGATLHAGWARPIFYGLFLLALHLKLTAWPVVIVQAAMSVLVIRLAVRRFLGRDVGEAAQLGIMALLGIATSLPWFASQLMPDLFGALVVLALATCALVPERMSARSRVLLLLFAAGLTTFHSSYIPISAAAVAVLLLWRIWQTRRLRAGDLAIVAAPALAMVLTIAANYVFLGAPSLSPYGQIFPMARMMIEGPGQRTLARECPRPDWSLCEQIGRIPPTFEEFLFGRDGTLNQAGGYKAVAAQAGPILQSTIRAEPETVFGDAGRRVVRQLGAFATGDWLNKPMPGLLEIWSEVFPPQEVARFAAAKQQNMVDLVPNGLQMLHRAVGFASYGALAFAVLVALRRPTPLGGLFATVAVTLLANAVITAGLSGVYDRYQSRFIWLAVLASAMLLLARVPAARTHAARPSAPIRRDAV